MPRRFRSRRPKRFLRKRKTFTRRRRGRAMTAGMVRRIIGAELKYSLLAVGPLPIPSSTGIVIPISSNIGQGLTIQTRVGNWITPRNIHGNLVVKGNLTAGAAGTDSFLLRAGIFCWKNDEQFDSPDVNQIVQDPLAPFGPLNFANRGSFRQVWGRTLTVVNRAGNAQFIKKLPFYIRLGRRKTLYDAGNPKKFQYFFFIHSDSIVVDEPIFNLDLTLRFNDA